LSDGALASAGAARTPRPRRFFIAAFGQPGHAFPMLALGTRLVERGHTVVYETWSRWRDDVEAAGMRFLPAPEYQVFPTPDRPVKPYEPVIAAARMTRQAVAEAEPDVVVHDILTLAPMLAAELEGIPTATLIPHLYPVSDPGFPPYAFGGRPPRTAVGQAIWRAFERPIQAGLRQGRRELNETRHQLGLPPVTRLYGGLSEDLCLVATFPQLEYDRDWPSHVHVVGPLTWEPPFHDVTPPPGEEPLVLVAPSTAQDPDHKLLRAALIGLTDEPIRVLATWNRRPLPEPTPVAANTRLVEWVSYTRTMPRCTLVVCHAGHGTMVRALAAGRPVLAVPHAGDMAENAVRVDWAGAGLRLPWRFATPLGVRLAVRRALERRSMWPRARELAAWAQVNDGATRAAELLETLALRRG
jgi:MGT family glycosyltransferase